MENEEFKNTKDTQQTPEMNEFSEDFSKKHKEGVVGPIIGSIIVIILIILGGIYYWNSIMEKKTQENTPNTEESIDQIEAEMEADMNELDAELDQMEAEFNNESNI